MLRNILNTHLVSPNYRFKIMRSSLMILQNPYCRTHCFSLENITILSGNTDVFMNPCVLIFFLSFQFQHQNIFVFQEKKLTVILRYNFWIIVILAWVLYFKLVFGIEPMIPSCLSLLLFFSIFSKETSFAQCMPVLFIKSSFNFLNTFFLMTILVFKSESYFEIWQKCY